MNGGITTSVNFWYKVSMSFRPKRWGWGEGLQMNVKRLRMFVVLLRGDPLPKTLTIFMTNFHYPVYDVTKTLHT